MKLVSYKSYRGVSWANTIEMLEVKNISKKFINTRALKNVEFCLGEGEIRGLVGENGSGKSTLVSIIAGIFQADTGSMIKDGTPYHPKSRLEANKEKVSIIVQEQGTIDGLTVATNLFLGKEREFTKYGVVQTKDMANEAVSVLARYGIEHIDPYGFIKELSFEDRKLLEFAKALHVDPDILIIDETTTALSHSGRGILFSELVKLKEENKSVIFITHDLSEVFDYCDNVSIMKDGEIIGTEKTSDIDERMLKEMMVGREFQHSYYREDFEANITGEIVIEVKNLVYSTDLSKVSFTLRKGEILGIGGLTDCGMHTLGRLLFGLDKADSGEIRYPFTNMPVRNHIQAIHAGIAYLPKNRDQQSIMLMSSVRDNLCLPSLEKMQRITFISPRKERQLAEDGAAKLNVKMDSIDQYCLYLSGGNKQKVALSKWLIKDSEVFILDCPTRGIDVAVKASIYQLIQILKQNRKSIIMISEELQELIGMSDRVIILKSGKIKKIFERSEHLSEEKIIHYMI
jgi:ribose transport system ATP-binding protein